MNDVEQIKMLKKRLNLIEGKCNLIAQKLEFELLKYSSNNMNPHVNYDYKNKVEMEKLRTDNDRLEKKIAYYRSSAWWYVKKPNWIYQLQNSVAKLFSSLSRKTKKYI